MCGQGRAIGCSPALRAFALVVAVPGRGKAAGAVWAVSLLVTLGWFGVCGGWEGHAPCCVPQLCSSDAALGFQHLETVDFSKFAG